MGVRVAVAGASGYAGGELLRIITGHPALEAGPLAAAASAGAPVTQAHPHLALLDGHVFEALDPARLSTADLVFLALPHEESAAVSAGLPTEVPVVDCLPGASPHPDITLAASAARTLTTTARE